MGSQTDMAPVDDLQRQRLGWRCRRGMAELDAILLGFVVAGFEELSAAERAVFERLLSYPDTLLIDWFMGRMVPTEGELARLVERIRRAPHP